MEALDLVRERRQCNTARSSRFPSSYGAASQASVSTSPLGRRTLSPPAHYKFRIVLCVSSPCSFPRCSTTCPLSCLVLLCDPGLVHAQVLQQCSSSLRPRAVLAVRYRSQKKKMSSRWAQDGSQISLARLSNIEAEKGRPSLNLKRRFGAILGPFLVSCWGQVDFSRTS